MTKSNVKHVVGVGASAGGLEAFKRLLTALDADSGMAFVLIQHLHPEHKSMLRELLSPITDMPVRDAEEGMKLEPNTVYVQRPDKALGIRDGAIEFSEPTLQRGVRLPIDHLFRSLANDSGSRAVGIVLSGAGSDGTSGLREIKAAGGLTIAQSPHSALQSGMPRSAIDSGTIDLVLEIEDIPTALKRFLAIPEDAHAALAAGDDGETSEVAKSSLHEAELDKLAELLARKIGFDLRVYKLPTVERRVLRRCALSGFSSFTTYLEHLESDTAELQTLAKDLLISVTDFFRDPEAFRYLRQRVIDPVVAATPAGGDIRVWVPACATGEEAYSLAIEFIESIEAAKHNAQLQVFATDIDQDALAIAREAVYPTAIAEQIPSERLAKHFRALEGRGYRVVSSVRDRVSFAVHDLAKDPPFSRIQLISCRNVLIYLTPAAQSRVLKLLHFGLEREGYLFLSTSETTGAQRELFATLSKPFRVYQKVGTSQPIGFARTRTLSASASLATARVRESTAKTVIEGDLARRAVVDAFAPPTLVVSIDGTVLFSHGALEPFIQFPQGDSPRFELSSILRPLLATRVRGVLYKCRRDRAAVEVLAETAPTADEAAMRVRIAARPAPTLGEDSVILSFERLRERPPSNPDLTSDVGSDEGLAAQLEDELRATREDLRTTVEELETSNEELRTSNEESMSMNEELQSANEELEATSEELRALNEELTTVNAELRDKVEQLEQANDDIQNFFASTKIATIFLDDRLCIKRITPAAKELISLEHSDLGRRVTDIARELLQHQLDEQARRALDSIEASTTEIRLADGRWIVRRTLPYRTESRRIEGVVMTFNDVTELRAANEQLSARTRRLDLAWDVAGGGIYELCVPPDETSYYSDQWSTLLGFAPSELPSGPEFSGWLQTRVHPDDVERVRHEYTKFLSGKTMQYRLEQRIRHRDGHWIWVRSVAKALERDERGRVKRLLGMMIDISDLKETESALRESEARFRTMSDELPLLVWVHGAKGELAFVNETFCDFYGVECTAERVAHSRWQDFVHPDDQSYVRRFAECFRERKPFHGLARVKRPDGSWSSIESWARPRYGSDGQFMGFLGTSADVTIRVQVEQQLKDNTKRFILAKEAAALGIYDWDVGAETLEWDSRMRELWNVGPDEPITYDRWLKSIHPDDWENVQESIRKAMSEPSDGHYVIDYRIVVPGQRRARWVHATGIVQFSPAGKPERLTGTIEDVTEQRSLEAERVEADQRKDEYLAMLGHELRNPLGAIRTAGQLIKLAPREANSRIVRAAEVIERQANHMASLLDGLLDLSRIRQGKLSVTMQEFSLLELLRNLISDRADEAEGKEIRVTLKAPDDSVRLRGDPNRIWQVFDNLLGNALKFTPKGGKIRVEVEIAPDLVSVVVADDGMGFAPDLAELLFEPFHQGEQDLSRTTGGLGIGLSLARSLVNLHGGTIEARSEGIGRGAEFAVNLPLPSLRSRGMSAGPKSRGAAKLDAMRIVIIDDNEDALTMLSEVLELAGHEVRTANRAASGLDLTRAWRPDIVVCDIGLPGGASGYDVARELRSKPETSHIALLALTGYGRPSDQQDAIAAGFDSHLTKPFDLATLEEKLIELLRDRHSD